MFYDGDCGFCNRSVNFVLKRDKTKSICFAPIQSELAKELFNKNNWPQPNLSTFYFMEEGVLYSKSTGALRLTKYFNYPQRLFCIFWIVPRFVRDWIYDLIANRRQLFSKGYCVIPDKEELERFLD